MSIVQAYKSDDFVDSMGVNTHWSYPSYSNNKTALKSILIDSGIRHIRDITLSQDLDQRQIISDLYNNGITSTMIIFPPGGVIPTIDYWSAYGVGETKTLIQYLDYMPSGAIDAIEMPNELDIFYGLYKWHPLDVDYLSNDSESPIYYGSYGVSVTQASYSVVRADSSYDNIKIIGPSVGVQVPSPFPDSSLYDYVDYGCFHPYPARANAFNPAAAYGTIINYYHNSFQPSSNVSTDSPYNTNPLMFTWYQPAFISGSNLRTMWATETGYSNGIGYFSNLLTARQTPRLYAEYFRNGIGRTFFYELINEGVDPNNAEENDGLLNNDLTPKPVFTALTSLISVLKEPDVSFNPGSLNYSLSVTPVGDYTRTDYVHDLLLQKSNGDFYLMIWHEISNSSDTDLSGDPIVGTQRDIDQPYLSTVITLPTSITNASVYTYNSGWTFDLTPLTITSNQITVQATDTLSIIRLQRSNVVGEFYLDLENGGRLIKEDGTGDILLETSGDNTNGGGQIPSSGSAIVADTYIRRLLLWWN